MTKFQDDPQTSHWHADKRIPVALIFAMLVQTGGIVWGAAGLYFRVGELTKDQTNTSARVGQIEAKLAAQDRTDAVIAEQLAATNENLGLLRADVQATNQLLREMFQSQRRSSP